MKKFLKKWGDEVLVTIVAIVLFCIIVFLSSCMSFDKAKRKFGNKAVEIENVPFQKAIAPDSAILNTNFEDMLTNTPISVQSSRSRITISKDASGNLRASAYADPIYIYDSIPYPVEKLVFKEADMDKYILRSEAEKQKKAATKAAAELALLQGQIKQTKKEHNLTFFDKVLGFIKGIGLGIVFLILIILLLLFIGKKVYNKFFPSLLVFLLVGCLVSCASLDLSRPLVVEGIRHENGSVFYDLSQTTKKGKVHYWQIKEEAGKKNLFDTVYLQLKDIRFMDN